MSMISTSSAVIKGGVFNQYVDQRQQKSTMDRLREAVSPTAFHNAGEKFDRPKCHPNTRVAVRDKVERWTLRMDPDTRDASILWLSGAAGAGKSAIAQTLAEHFHAKGLLVASFFFGRSDLTRNHARSLISTIVYQLYPLLPPPEQSRISAVIDHEPLIFTKSLLDQFKALIVNPLQPLLNSGFWARRLIIIDGLDECLDHEMQRSVLLLLYASVRQFHLPFIFLLASRPEHDIQAIFSSPNFLLIHTRLFLDNTYLPDRDIERFLRDQFEECRTTHPFRHMIPPDWPSDDIVNAITSKSSGQFIYASVVTKYVKSSRHQPHHRLDVVLNLRPALRDLPFSELDALYTHIFSKVDDIESILNVISFHIRFSSSTVVDHIERILRLDAGEVKVLLCDLASVICYEKGLPLKILHASLADYLLDSARSEKYFIGASKRHAEHVADCFRFFSYDQGQDFVNIVERVISCIKMGLLSVDLTDPLYNAIRGFSIPRIFDLILKVEPESDRSQLLNLVVFSFLPALFRFLKKLDSDSDSGQFLELYHHHQSEYDFVLRKHVKACLPKSTTSLGFALIALYRKLPIGAFHYWFSLFGSPWFGDEVLAAFELPSSSGNHCTHPAALEYLSDFLRNPKRSREFWAGPMLFAQAAKHCLLYLCDHTASAQKAPFRMSAQQRLRRKHTPWKWHRRVLREDIRGPRVTPWLWLRCHSWSANRTMETLIFHKKTNDLIYIHASDLLTPGLLTLDLLTANYQISDFEAIDDPVIKHRICSEKYYLVLTYLNHFLPRAANLDDLVHMSQKLTFGSRCQDFPRESAQARSNMQKYAAQWG